MTKLETEFTAELRAVLEQAQSLTGIPESRLRVQAEKAGGVKAVKELLRRGQTTRQFDALRELHRLNLTPEYLVTRGKYGPLFTDEEVDLCLRALLEAGAFTG